MTDALLEKMIKIVRRRRKKLTESFLRSWDVRDTAKGSFPDENDEKDVSCFLTFFDDLAASFKDKDLRAIIEGYLADGMVDYKARPATTRPVRLPKLIVEYHRPKMPKRMEKKD